VINCSCRAEDGRIQLVYAGDGRVFRADHHREKPVSLRVTGGARVDDTVAGQFLRGA
jgi:hypothetical protein